MKTWLLPPTIPEPASAYRDLGALRLGVPEVTPALVNGAVQRLRAAQPGWLELKTDTILQAIDETIMEWLAPESEARQAAQQAFCATTGMPAATAPFIPLLNACRSPSVREWAQAEVEPFEALDGYVARGDGSLQRAVGPKLVLHVLSGNVPAVWLPALLACVVMRSPCLLKPAADDPLTPALFAATLVRKLPPLADGLAVLPWKGGHEAVEREALRGAEAVVAYGGDEALRSLRAVSEAEGLARSAAGEIRWLAHGPRFAAGVIGRDAAAAPVLAAAARDALLYDGRGCLSLSAVLVETGGRAAPRQVAEQLARALETASADLPPGRPGSDAAAQTQTWRGRIRARALAGKPAAVFASPQGLAWTLCFDEELPSPEGAMVRTVWVNPFDRLDEVPSRLASSGRQVHALAFAGPPAQRAQLAEMLAGGESIWLTEFGNLQTPPLTWPHRGASPFKRLVRWVRP